MGVQQFQAESVSAHDKVNGSLDDLEWRFTSAWARFRVGPLDDVEHQIPAATAICTRSGQSGKDETGPQPMSSTSRLTASEEVEKPP